MQRSNANEFYVEYFARDAAGTPISLCAIVNRSTGEIIDKFNDMSEEEQKNLEELKKNSPIYNPNMNKPKEQENSNNEKQQDDSDNKENNESSNNEPSVKEESNQQPKQNVKLKNLSKNQIRKNNKTLKRLQAQKKLRIKIRMIIYLSNQRQGGMRNVA